MCPFGSGIGRRINSLLKFEFVIIVTKERPFPTLWFAIGPSCVSVHHCPVGLPAVMKWGAVDHFNVATVPEERGLTLLRFKDFESREPHVAGGYPIRQRSSRSCYQWRFSKSSSNASVMTSLRFLMVGTSSVTGHPTRLLESWSFGLLGW